MKLRSFIPFALLVGLMIIVLGAGSTRANSTARQIAINGMRLHPGQIQDVDRLLGHPLPSGRYWHDVRTGSWGRIGGPALGLMPGSYVPQTRAAGYTPGNDVASQPNSTHRISTMIDLDTDSSGPDHIFNTRH